MDPGQLRALFPAVKHATYLNNAGVAPCSIRVVDAMHSWLQRFSQVGIVDEESWEELAERTRASVARLLGSKSSEVCFVRNTSHGLSLVAEGIDWQPSDAVSVCLSEEYPSNIYPWQRLADEGRIVLQPIRADRGGVTLEGLRDAVTTHTRLVAVSAIQYSSGHRTELSRIGAFCRERDILLAVDGIQQVGAFPLDVERCGIDFLSADSHKWMLGLSGIGFLYVRENCLELMRPALVGWKSTVGAWNFDEAVWSPRVHADKLEEGSPAYAMLAGLEAAVALLHEVGVEHIAAHIGELLEYASVGFSRIGCRVSPAPEERGGLLLVEHPEQGDWSARVAEQCARRNIAVSVRRQRLRVSPHAYNTHQDIDTLLQVAESIAAG